MRPEDIPKVLLDILDQRAGKKHRLEGPVVSCLAEILTVYKEVNMNQDQWYVSMAAAIKRRDHAIRMLNRWQQQLADAEHEIEKLATGAEQVPAQEQEHVHDTLVQ